MAESPVTNHELADLNRELEAVKTRVGQLERQRNDAIDALASATGLSRRQVLGIIGGGAGMGALGMLATGQARAAASTSDSDGDIGTPSSRADLFTDGINYAMAEPSSAETVSEPIIAYDCSVSGFTITLDSALEPANGTQMVMLVDQTGNAGTNQVTVTATSNIDGGANITINHDNAVTILLWDGSEWRSTRFIDTVDAGTVTTGDIDIDSLDTIDTTTAYLTVPPSVGAAEDFGLSAQETESVGTSAKIILAHHTTTSVSAGILAVVSGRDSDGDRWLEVVSGLYDRSVTVLSTETNGTPNGRTYSMNARNLQLAMDSGTADVTVHAITSANA